MERENVYERGESVYERDKCCNTSSAPIQFQYLTAVKI